MQLKSAGLFRACSGGLGQQLEVLSLPAENRDVGVSDSDGMWVKGIVQLSMALNLYKFIGVIIYCHSG